MLPVVAVNCSVKVRCSCDTSFPLVDLERCLLLWCAALSSHHVQYINCLFSSVLVVFKWVIDILQVVLETILGSREQADLKLRWHSPGHKPMGG